MSTFAAYGRRIFSKRLYIGLAVAFVGLELLVPAPFLGSSYISAQVAGLICIALGLGLRAWGSGCAGAHTRSGKIESQRLVTGGPFAYVRNPIYVGSILLGVGMSALIGDPLAYGMTALAFCLLYFGIIPAEEEHLSQTFGAEYNSYRMAVPRLVPRIRPWTSHDAVIFQWRAACGELVIGLLLVGIYLALHGEEYLDRVFPWA